MTANVFRWMKMFYFCLGLFLASTFCMKWIESEFVANGKSFSIMDLELYLGKDALKQLLNSLDDKARTVVSYHLHFDFFFMAGVFPGIASIAMLVKEKVEKRSIRFLLIIVAALQLLAWACDIYENTHLLKWLNDPSTISNFQFYHLLVKIKFIIAFAGLLIAGVSFLLFRKKFTLQNQS